MNRHRYAILMDGGFVIAKVKSALGRFPDATSIDAVARALEQRAELAQTELLRIFFYHARPASAVLIHPLSGEPIDLAATPQFRSNQELIAALELTPDFSVRLGETTGGEWRLGSAAMKSLLRSQRAIEANDLVPGLRQKGVDLRIGLDLARFALRELVGSVIVVSGDSDLIPAFKFVRREGVRVTLATLGHGVRRDLKVHADRVIEATPIHLGLGRD